MTYNSLSTFASGGNGGGNGVSNNRGIGGRLTVGVQNQFPYGGGCGGIGGNDTGFDGQAGMGPGGGYYGTGVFQDSQSIGGGGGGGAMGLVNINFNSNFIAFNGFGTIISKTISLVGMVAMHYKVMVELVLMVILEGGGGGGGAAGNNGIGGNGGNGFAILTFY